MSNTSTPEVEADPVEAAFSTVVRMTKDVEFDGRHLSVGQVLPHEGTDPIGWPLVTLPGAIGRIVPLKPWECEVIPAYVADLHVITERADGPDLDDLVRLIRFHRSHHRVPTVSSAITAEGQLRVEWEAGRLGRFRVTEGQPDPEAYFVGPDGTVYDCNGNPL